MIKARASGSKVYLYFMKKGRQARHRIPRNSCFVVFFLFFFYCLNATIPLTSTLANEYPSSNETSKKNGKVQGDCIPCNALL